MTRLLFIVTLTLMLAGCGGISQGSGPLRLAMSDEPAAPVMRWDHRPEATEWTNTTLTALETHGAPLWTLVPSDIDAWCPAYARASDHDRRLFWTGLFSALSKHESTYNPRAIGGGNLWFGLVQIAPATARWHGCDVTSGTGLLDGSANLRCAVRIAANQVPKKGSVTRGMRDWGPFHSNRKRADMMAWTRAQPYCRG